MQFFIHYFARHSVSKVTDFKYVSFTLAALPLDLHYQQALSAQAIDQLILGGCIGAALL